MPQLASTSSPTDEHLARAAASGEMASFEELVRRYQVPLLRFLRQRFPNVRDSEDVLQDVILSAWQHIGDFDPTRSFRAWMFAITHYAAISQTRKRPMPGGDEAVADHPCPDAAPLATLARQDTRRALWDCVKSAVNDDAFTMMWMYHVQDASTIEIAQALGRSQESVRTAMHRARETLRADVEFVSKAGDL